MSANLCFYGPSLVHVSILAVDPDSPFKPWSEELAGEIKRFHDAWLRQTLMKSPREVERPYPRPFSDDVLGTTLHWKYSWGSVSSFHEIRSYSTDITVGYGKRNQEAQKDYRRRAG